MRKDYNSVHMILGEQSNLTKANALKYSAPEEDLNHQFVLTYIVNAIIRENTFKFVQMMPS
jgi:hypothetical protein